MIGYKNYFIIENEKDLATHFIDNNDYTLRCGRFSVPITNQPTVFPCAYKLVMDCHWKQCSVLEAKNALFDTLQTDQLIIQELQTKLINFNKKA